ncbi:alcohol dehydrogenase class IV [Variovorax paradoxus]|jgi:alcohol dehydrogenase class IV|uniref:Alcohol dehydrogenase class IV n=1 Tax=Variovorax paradoxus TaxID=34073 RepID=A0AAW8EPS0_VARPD|nr:iron-containing alcohol dehydrogenase [Variovorax paradoxus]MDP9974876.1 alcohol dehydrogenase class IV [Variovorax paradoxus]
MQDFEFTTCKTLSVSRGGAARLADKVAAMGGRSVLIITDAGLLRSGILQPTLNGFEKAGILVALFSDVQADPPEAVIHAAAAAARSAKADCVIGFGGGSSMDVAKLAALLASSGEILSGVYGVGQAKGPRLRLILVPTTAGTGSEVTPISIVTTAEGGKKGVLSPVLLPDLALLDAELTLGLPSHVTAATGIDAMVHAIEAYTSKQLKNPISDCLAKEALRLLSRSLHKACEAGDDLHGREDMLLGACLAGIAFANAPVAGVHALAYPIGAQFHVPHGLSNALVLPAVARFNLPAAQKEYAELLEIVRPGFQGSEARKAEAFVDYVGGLAPSVGLPVTLREVGIKSEHIGALASDAMKQTRLLVNNPRELTESDAAALYLEVL